MPCPDVVVVGAGIVGASCAYYLSLARLRVLLVDKGPVMSGTSKAGQTHICLWEMPEANLRLARASRALYEELAERLPFGFEYRRTGCVAVVDDHAAWSAFEESLGVLRGLGVECTKLMPDDLARMEPNLSRDLAGGGYFPADSQVNPMLAGLSLIEGAKAMGAEVMPRTEVQGIEQSPTGAVVAVRTSAGKIPTRAVVNAAGPWSEEVGRMVGLRIPVKPRRGHLIVTEPVPFNLINCEIVIGASYMQTLSDAGGLALAANVQQTLSGNMLIGSSREFAGMDWSASQTVIEAMLPRNLAMLPALRGVQAIRVYAGLRPHSPDLVPIIGPVEGVEGYYTACGHEGAGITMGPITGKLISDAVTGQATCLPMQPYALSRFAPETRSD